MTRKRDAVTATGYGSRIPVVLLQHPFELALGAALVVNCLRAGLGDVSPSLAQLPTVLVVVYFVVSAVGGVGVIVGIALRENRQEHGKQVGICVAIERSALFLVAASYVTLAIAIIGVNGADGIGTAIVTTVVAAACILRAIGIRRTARLILATLIVVNRESGSVP